MRTTLLSLYSRLQNLILREEGQDLIEYALVVALIAFAAVTSMQTLAADINAVFLALGTELTAA
jgi:pilus assembly protein Flp/PilA